MDCSIDLFDGVTNIDFKGLALVEELKAEVPVFKLREPSPEEWNKRAREQNTKIFIQLHKRQPKDYNEVLVWINGDNDNFLKLNEVSSELRKKANNYLGYQLEDATNEEDREAILIALKVLTKE
jgi:hypothetical protein